MATNDEARPPGARKTGAGGTGRQHSAGQARCDSTSFRQHMAKAFEAAQSDPDRPAFLLEPATCPGCGGSLRRPGGVSVFIPRGILCTVVMPLCARCGDAFNGVVPGKERVADRAEEVALLHLAVLGVAP